MCTVLYANQSEAPTISALSFQARTVTTASFFLLLILKNFRLTG